MLEAKTRIVEIGDSCYMLIPADVLKDSTFPFNKNIELIVKIKDKKLEVCK